MANPSATVLFDFDGTLVRGDCAAAWLRDQLRSHPLRRFHACTRKITALARQGIRPPFAAVYSDSDWDLPLLCETARPVLVRPTERSLARVHRRLRGAFETLL